VNAGVEPRCSQDVVEVMPDFEVSPMKPAVFAMKQDQPHTTPRLTDPQPMNSLVESRIAASICTFATLRYRPSENPRIARLKRPSRAGTMARNPV
jgi:hypothetical protein